MDNEVRRKRINKIVEIVKTNKNLPVNEIKRKVRKEYPDINGEELVKIILNHSDEIRKTKKRERKVNKKASGEMNI